MDEDTPADTPAEDASASAEIPEASPPPKKKKAPKKPKKSASRGSKARRTSGGVIGALSLLDELEKARSTKKRLDDQYLETDAKRNRLRRESRAADRVVAECEKKLRTAVLIAAGEAYERLRPGGLAHPQTRRELSSNVTDPRQRAMLKLPPLLEKEGGDQTTLL